MAKNNARRFLHQELFSVANEFEANNLGNDSLGDFLTQISLYTDLDNLKLTNNKMTLMTLHLAKGLEFPVAFICGLEEGIFPHRRSIDSNDDSELEEERRLMYVGVTRAKEKLYFTYARERRLFGVNEYSQVSRFIEEAPGELLSGFYGGLDEKIENKRMHIKRKNIERKYSDYEIDELINLEGVSNVTKIKKLEDKSTHHSSLNTHHSFSVGDKVMHEKFGSGVVEQLYGEGSKLLVNVNFEMVGKKLLDPRYAKLVTL